ncbi:neuropeptide CCHamide-1 receptor [Neocloeon triangulifer]|uniref:neuropeptide CCHamide-1 receptor n=1 Tax=Neocloeon triangulifer TaxID=2078957 RepID=UPI00286ED4B8|nr:neuropeptide CCHamide-1 receptor [Neocloeon triangulifer]XP_059483797.1 neuropeptide CCHamide-1 receptor [Neocloeon triangulifer]XP_059483798.1 neuropeptide CCHamide-1 receptor [Neocloeon triangulifer]XP_059483799.1 neuropeptide CCHamide-1 receptor [Neocloeon triangulifer]
MASEMESELWMNLSAYNDSMFDNGTMEGGYVAFSDRPETYIVPILFAVVFVVGVLGNGTLVLIFGRHRRMRNVPNTYIFSLALGDLLLIVTCVPFTSTVYTIETWPYGLFICKLSEFVKDLSIGVSVFTLTALSADRYFAIVDPMRKHVGRATKLTVAIAVSIWLLAAACALPALFGSYLRSFQVSPTQTIRVCYPWAEEWGANFPRQIVTVRFVVFYLAPLSVIGVFYALMARHLLISARRGLPGEAHAQTRQAAARKKVAKTVLAFVVVFAVCFLPQHVFLLWFYHNPSAPDDYNGFWHAFRIAGFCMAFSNSCVNPIALYCVSGTFRKHFKRHLFCCCCPVSAEDAAPPGGTATRTLRSTLNHRQPLTRGTSKTTTWDSCHSMVHFNSTVRGRPPADHVALTTALNGSSEKT